MIAMSHGYRFIYLKVHEKIKNKNINIDSNNADQVWLDNYMELFEEFLEERLYETAKFMLDDSRHFLYLNYGKVINEKMGEKWRLHNERSSFEIF